MNIKLNKLSDYFNILKEVFLVLLILISTGFLFYGVYKSAIDQTVKFDPILVPSQFLDKGFTPEVTTIRLVDEVKKINLIANTTKKRDSHSSGQANQELTNITSSALPGVVDIKAIQALIRGVLGIHTRSISGDITLLGDAKNEAYLVRVRENSSGKLLVDQIFQGPQEKVLELTALKLVEKIDPVVAASYYRNTNQTLDTLRMVDIAQASDNPEDIIYGLTQAVYIYINQKKYEQAKIELNKVFEIDKNAANGLGLLAVWYNNQSRFKEGLEVSEKQIKARPDLPHGYLNKAISNKGLGIDDDTVYLEALSKKQIRPNHYIMIGNYFESRNKLDLARKAYLKAAIIFPDNEMTNYWHGSRLFLDGKNDLAIYYLKKSYALNPNNKKIQEALLRALDGSADDSLKIILKRQLN